jgi:hypothetical protein
MIQATFKEWTLNKIDKAFGTKQLRHLPALEELLRFPYTFSEYERRFLEELREQYFLGGDEWNEVELENKFISPLIVFAKIDNEKFAYFLERPLTAVVGEYELSGRVDGMIASGYREPEIPFFCLNEYKRQSDPDGNPQGQVLATMIAAQRLNGTDSSKPLFGCYVIGSTWYFVVLQGFHYAVSTPLVCTNDGIFDIFRVLKGLRVAIENILNAKGE